MNSAAKREVMDFLLLFLTFIFPLKQPCLTTLVTLYGIFLFISLVHAHVWGLLTNFVYICATAAQSAGDVQTGSH